MRGLTEYAQSIVSKGKHEDPNFFKKKSGPVPGILDQYVSEFNYLVREESCNLDKTDFDKIVRGDIFSINLNDAEPYSGDPSTEKKLKLDDKPVHGFHTLLMLFQCFQKYLAVVWGARDSANAIAYWTATLETLKRVNCPWDHAYNLFRTQLKDLKCRWVDFNARGPAPRPEALEPVTRRLYQQCVNLGGMQTNFAAIREGWTKMPVALPSGGGKQQSSTNTIDVEVEEPPNKRLRSAETAIPVRFKTAIALSKTSTRNCHKGGKCNFFNKFKCCAFFHPEAPPGTADRPLGAALTEDKRPTGRPDLPAIIMAVVAVVATLVTVPVVIVQEIVVTVVR